MLAQEFITRTKSFDDNTITDVSTEPTSALEHEGNTSPSLQATLQHMLESCTPES